MCLCMYGDEYYYHMTLPTVRVCVRYKYYYMTTHDVCVCVDVYGTTTCNTTTYHYVVEV